VRSHSVLKLLLLLSCPIDWLGLLFLFDFLWLLLLRLELCLLQRICTRLNGVLLLRCVSKCLLLCELLGFGNYLLLSLIGTYILCDHLPSVWNGSGILNYGFTQLGELFHCPVSLLSVLLLLGLLLLLALKLLLRTLSFCYYPLNLLFEVLCRGTSIEPSESLCI